MRAVSPKRAKELRQYMKQRDAFLAGRDGEGRCCEFPGCQQQATVVHHKRGRAGLRLLDDRFWAAACVPHNDFAETNTGEALAVGWLIRIEGVAS